VAIAPRQDSGYGAPHKAKDCAFITKIVMMPFGVAPMAFKIAMSRRRSMTSRMSVVVNVERGDQNYECDDHDADAALERERGKQRPIRFLPINHHVSTPSLLPYLRPLFV